MRPSLGHWLRGLFSGLVLIAWVLGLGPGAQAAQSAPAWPQEVQVASAYDGKPFTYRIEGVKDHRAYEVLYLSYPSPVVTAVIQNNTIPAEYYVPKGIEPDDPKRPAVICLHILDGSLELVRMMSVALASRGVPAIIFRLPYYGPRGLPEGPHALAKDPKLFLSAIAQALQDVRRTVDVLASRPEVASDQIGIMGISLGGITAASAAAWEPRIGRVALILAGGDLRRIIHHARETTELRRLIETLDPDERRQVEEAIEAADPLRGAERLRDRAQQGRVLMINATDDDVIPRPCAEKLAAALGISDRVVWLDGLGHYTAMAALPQVLAMTVDFFSEDLEPALRTSPPPPPAGDPTHIVASFVQQASAWLLVAPARGRCRFLDLEAVVTPAGQPPIEARVRLVVGAERRFRLEARAPVVGELVLGNGRFPWMVAAGKKTVYEGTAEAASAPNDPLAWVAPEHLLRLRMVGGVLAGVSLAPQVLADLADIASGPDQDGQRTIVVRLKGQAQGTLRMLLANDGRTPQRVDFEFGNVQGVVHVRTWQPDTVGPDELFEPPAGLDTQQVRREDLARMFSAVLNFAMENIQ